ncbi:helix-turn-helix domain-containing protein [Streptomyces monticola]|uniref:Helix-turn-helix domain-containing protein n=1 Tax=Streptomyces monticola TaxID=2666263 RepID=A0ABW2JXP7_9ACTN
MPQQPEFGRRLKRLRTARGLSQAALVGDGMSTGYLSRLESGERRPTERAVAYLAARLGVEAADFDRPDGSLARALTLATSTGSDDAMEALRTALREDTESSALQRWQALWLLARARRLQGDHAGERAHLDALTAVGDEVGLPELRARGLTALARCLRSLGEIGPAGTAAVEAHRLARAHDLAVADRATALLALVSVTAEAGRLPDAGGYADELTALVAGRHDALWAEAMWTAAAVRVRQGDHAAAQAHLDDALAHFTSGDDLVLWLRLRLAAARLQLCKRPPRPDAAEPLVDAAQAALAFVGTPALHQELAAIKADLAFCAGRYEEARVLLRELADDEPRMTYRDRARLDILRNQLRVMDGDPAGAEGLRALAEQAQAVANIDLAAEIWRILAETGTAAPAPSGAPAPPGAVRSRSPQLPL